MRWSRAQLQVVCLSSVLASLLGVASCASSNKTPDRREATPKDTVIPETPTQVQALAKGNQITISWAEADDASAYNVYWSNKSGVNPESGEKMARITSTSIPHRDLKAKTTYYYIVTSLGPGGQSTPSKQVSATTE